MPRQLPTAPAPRPRSAGEPGKLSQVKNRGSKSTEGTLLVFLWNLDPWVGNHYAQELCWIQPALTSDLTVCLSLELEK